MSEESEREPAANLTRLRDIRKLSEAAAGGHSPEMGVATLSSDSIDWFRIVHELRTYEDELCQQNEVLREAQVALNLHKRKFTQLFEYAPVGYVTLDAHGTIYDINQYARTLLEVERDEVTMMPLLPFLCEDDHQALMQHIGNVFAGRESALRIALHSRSDRRHVVSLFSTVIEGEDGGCDLCLVAIINVTIEHEQSESLRLAGNIIDYMPIGAVVSDSSDNIVSVNPAFCRISGYTESDIIGQPVYSWFDPQSHQDIATRKRERLQTHGHWQGEVRLRHARGHLVAALISVNWLKNAAGERTHTIALISDISEQEQNRERIRQLAFFDPLTGLPNRYLVMERFNQVLKIARRESWRFAAMFLDLNRFKMINDTLGHDIGDQLLQKVGRRIADVLREEDTVGRMSGDEFVIICPDIGNATNAARIAKKVLSVFEDDFGLGNRRYFVDASIGISIFPEDGLSASKLLKNADAAMYRAKATGSNQHCFAQRENESAAFERLDLESDLRRALKNDEFRTFLQPQVCLVTGEVHAVEALVRWQHPERGLLEPGCFLSVAEESGCIIDLGYRILEQACQALKLIEATAGVPVKMAVNLSPRQFLHEELLENILRILDQTGVDPALLELEITEGSAMPNFEYALKVIQAMCERNIQVVIDDFGTGFSSLEYLRKLPVRKLKIAQNFVEGTPADQQNASIAETIVSIARTLEMTVVAEGVETQVQHGFLADLGCELGQGYLYSRPMAAESFGGWLKDYNNQQAQRRLPFEWEQPPLSVTDGADEVVI